MFRWITVLAAVLALAVPTAAAAQSDPLAQERYYSSYGGPAQSDLLAQERYYSSYGEPAPVAAPAVPAVPADDDAPWKALAIVSGALVVALLGAEAFTLARLRRAT
jgi:hypothetical protein